ncbi:PREDICTED: BTB/POZ domain-containing protein 6-B-like [Acropora digitifera]|uniref:BTB/POZ domain-containing protein 6-B-like n=1 Tax=Acropora digitifera TaxID=70779 RepID=UPI00077A9145|nr:PREDICTED: BTB/POZ domain-containing protein 6-B-like [Acropora digitifera]
MNGNNVSGLLNLSKKYMMPPLADKCSEFLVSNMYPSNVLSVLKVAELHKEEKIVNLCWKMIDGQTEAVLRERIERPHLETIVTRDTLKMDEVKLFAAVDKWATSECEEKGLTPDGKTKRTVLGEQIIKAIRFPVMERHEFSRVVTPSGILSDEEVSQLQKYFEKTLDGPVGFPEQSRTSLDHLDRRQRFRYSGGSWSYQRGLRDALVFEVDGHIELYGLRLFGRLNSNYSVNLELINEESGEKVLSQTGNFTSVPLKTYGGSVYYGFEFLFDQPVNIDTVTKYRVEALISGPSSEKAKNCYRNTDWFTFSAYDNENNGTNAREGQFPEFVFRRHRL